MYEFGNYLGTLDFAVIPYELDEEYIEHLQNLSHEELIEVVIDLQLQIETMNKFDYWKGWYSCVLLENILTKNSMEVVAMIRKKIAYLTLY